MTDLRKYARGKPCMIRAPFVCNGDPETTVLCHPRLAGITGAGLKAPDELGAWGCSSCHDFVDARQMGHKELSHELRVTYLYEGILRTQYQLIKDGVIHV